jgi:hypothetical protein
MTDIPRRPPWLVESIVIVSSILLAFTIDAGWGRYQEATRAEELVTNLREELLLARTQLQQQLDESSAGRDDLRRFIQSTPEVLATTPPGESWSRVYWPLMRIWSFSAPSGHLDAAISSGTLSLIEDADARAALSHLTARYRDVDALIRPLDDIHVQSALRMGRIPGVRDRQVETRRGTGLSPETLNAMRSDPELVAIASAKLVFWTPYLAEQRLLLEALERAIDLLGG